MKKIIYIFAGLIILAGLAYLLFKIRPTGRTAAPSPIPTVEPTQTPTVTPTASTSAQPNELNIQLNQLSKSNETGTAKITQLNGKVVVILNISNAPAKISQPAHIHSGSCPDVGDVKYPLNSPVNGKSETTLDLTMNELLKNLPLAINVHKSTSETKVSVACGDVKTP